jgi:hypothetical protein
MMSEVKIIFKLDKENDGKRGVKVDPMKVVGENDEARVGSNAWDYRYAESLLPAQPALFCESE